MDTYRSPLGGTALAGDGDPSAMTEHELSEEVHEAPPPAIGTDERRMQVRAYNYWAMALGERMFPDIADLDPAAMDDFGPYSVLLDFSQSSDDPGIAYLGAKLSLECGAGEAIGRLSDVPARSLLSRITDHYLQIIANQAPIGFEAEFVNARGATILYRGILLPFSSDNATIDYIYGVINWKELADPAAADELLLQMDQALAAGPAGRTRRAEPAPLADWADGPGAIVAAPIDDAEFDDLAQAAADAGFVPASVETVMRVPAAGEPLSQWLELARATAAAVNEGEERTRNALYEAIGRAWDFALAAAAAPEEFAALLAQAGLSAQERAPMTPVVKLVFGAHYDKTRLTEYAAALTHARRLGLGLGELAAYLRQAEGGLKGVVAEERRHRRGEPGAEPHARRALLRRAVARRLREATPRPLSALAASGEEFALVLVRRTPAGEVALIGEVAPDAAMLERAARRLLA